MNENLITEIRLELIPCIHVNHNPIPSAFLSVHKIQFLILTNNFNIIMEDKKLLFL